MKTLRQFCAGIALTVILAVPVFAGKIDCGVTDPPPPEATAPGEMLMPVAEAIAVALLSLS
jgi:hypothetical protein